MPENKKAQPNGSANDELASKALNKMKILDALVAFTLSLIFFAVAYGVLIKSIGVWAIWGASVLSVAAVFILMKLTGLKSQSVLKFSAPKKRETAGGALLLAASIVVSIPPILFSQLLAPRLAATSFNIYSIVSGPSVTFFSILTVIFIALCENILFDGYIYSRLTGIKSVAVRAVFAAIMASVMRFDAYAFAGVFISSIAAFIARRETSSMTLPLVIRLFSVSFVIAISGLSAGADALVGEAMGAVQVSGLTLIFLGIALPVGALALSLFGKLRQNGKLIGFSCAIISIILVAAGCGVSSL